MSASRHPWTIAPYFLVDDVVATAEYYAEKLGFHYDRLWGDPPAFCMVKRRGITITFAASRYIETHEAWSTMKRESGGYHRPREARLRSASVHLFPGVPADVWIQAASMADIVASKRLQRGDITLAERVLDPAHFEFRQGGRQPETETPLRRRATDRLRLQGD